MFKVLLIEQRALVSMVFMTYEIFTKYTTKMIILSKQNREKKGKARYYDSQ